MNDEEIQAAQARNRDKRTQQTGENLAKSVQERKDKQQSQSDGSGSSQPAT